MTKKAKIQQWRMKHIEVYKEIFQKTGGAIGVHVFFPHPTLLKRPHPIPSPSSCQCPIFFFTYYNMISNEEFTWDRNGLQSVNSVWRPSEKISVLEMDGAIGKMMQGESVF